MKKNMMRILTVLMLGAGLVYFSSCSSKKDDGPTALTINSATANGVDINGATAATGVDASAVVTVTFNTAVDATTATNSNITLKRDFDGADVPLTITTAGNVVTITPTTVPLYGGALYVLSVGSGVKSTGGLAIASLTRSFTTSGSFLPSGEVAHWGFENNVNDDAGSGTNYNAPSTGIVDLTYADGRNAAAGKAASFNGTTSIAEVPNGPSLMTSHDFTMSFWVKANYNIHTVDSKADTATNFVIGLGGYKGMEWEFAPKFQNAKLAASYDFGDAIQAEDLWMDATGNVGFGGWTYSKDLGTGGLAPTVAGQWANFIVIYNGDTKVGTIYMNGVKQKSQDFNLYSGDRLNAVGMAFQGGDGVGTNLAFGFYSDRATTAFDFANYSDVNGGHYNGLLDDVRIFHKALTEQELTLMYNSEKP